MEQAFGDHEQAFGKIKCAFGNHEQSFERMKSAFGDYEHAFGRLKSAFGEGRKLKNQPLSLGIKGKKVDFLLMC